MATYYGQTREMYDKREKYLNDKRSKTTVEQKNYLIRGANTVVVNEKTDYEKV